jgi:DNA-binding transcriptional LysR family regulator
MVVLPTGHSLAPKRSLRFAEVLDHPLVGIQSGGALDQFLHERAVAVHKALPLRVSVASFDAACRMVEAGLGIAVIPHSAASAYAGARRFVRRPLEEPWAERELSIYALRKTPRLRAVQELIGALKGSSASGE